MKEASDAAGRLGELRKLSDEELHGRFWQLADEIVAPMVELAKTHTSPSIERSVLLRGGLTSDEAQQIVSVALDRRLLGLGAANLVLRLSRKRGVSFAEAGKMLATGQGWEDVPGDA